MFVQGSLSPAGCGPGRDDDVGEERPPPVQDDSHEDEDGQGGDGNVDLGPAALNAGGPFVPCKIEKEWKIWFASISDIAWPLLLFVDSEQYPWLSPLSMPREVESIKSHRLLSTTMIVYLWIAYSIQFLMGVALLVRLAIGNITRLRTRTLLLLYWCVSFCLIYMMGLVALPTSFFLVTPHAHNWIPELSQMLHIVIYMGIRWLNSRNIYNGYLFQRAHDAGVHRHCKLARRVEEIPL